MLEERLVFPKITIYYGGRDGSVFGRRNCFGDHPIGTLLIGNLSLQLAMFPANEPGQY
jgi:hypothetical protein